MVALRLAFRLFTRCLNKVKRSKWFYTLKNTYNYICACKKSSILAFIHIYLSKINYFGMYIYLCMWKEPNIDIYECNILSVYIYKYNKLKYTNLSLENWTRFTSCSPKRLFKQRLAHLMLFISVPFRPFFVFFDRLNGQPFNFCLPPKQNSLPPFTVYWLFKRPFNPFRRTLIVACFWGA